MNKEGYKRLNEVLNLSSKILKILYVLILISALWIVSKTWELWGISNFIKIIFELLSPLFIGFMIAYLLNPIVSKLQKKGIKRIIGASIIYVLFISMLYFLITSLFPILINQINDLIKLGPKLLDGFNNLLDSILKTFNIGDLDITKIKKDIILNISEYFSNSKVFMPSNIILIIGKMLSSILVLVISLFIGFYMLIDFDSSVKALSNLIPKKIRKSTLELFIKINNSVFAFVKGMLFILIIMFVVGTIAFSCIGLKGAVVLGLFNAITNIIPYVGPYIGGLPIIAIGFSYSFQTGVLVTIVVMIIQFLESYILNPVVMSKTMKLHPVTIMLGLLIFGYFFGIIGMIIATPVISILKIIFKYFEDKKEENSIKIEDK